MIQEKIKHIICKGVQKLYPDIIITNKKASEEKPVSNEEKPINEEKCTVAPVVYANAMRETIDRLFYRLGVIKDTFQSSEVIVERNHSYNKFIEFRMYDIDTTYGKRRFAVSDNGWFSYGKPEDFYQVLEYSSCGERYVTFDGEMFAVYAVNNKVEIRPFPLVGWTSKQVGLAIAECDFKVDKRFREALALRDDTRYIALDLKKGTFLLKD